MGTVEKTGDGIKREVLSRWDWGREGEGEVSVHNLSVVSGCGGGDGRGELCFAGNSLSL